MRTETKEIKWYHYPKELPQGEYAEVLARAMSEESFRMGYFTMLWINTPRTQYGFVYAGNPIAKMRHDSYYPFNEFEWCYLTDEHSIDGEGRLISTF